MAGKTPNSKQVSSGPLEDRTHTALHWRPPPPAAPPNAPRRVGRRCTPTAKPRSSAAARPSLVGSRGRAEMELQAQSSRRWRESGPQSLATTTGSEKGTEADTARRGLILGRRHASRHAARRGCCGEQRRGCEVLFQRLLVIFKCASEVPFVTFQKEARTRVGSLPGSLEKARCPCAPVLQP